MGEIEATTDDLDETIGDVKVVMDDLQEEFELLKRDFKWGIVLFVATVTVVIVVTGLLLG